ncbi:MAG: aldose epimerase [Anaerolineae bacterium]|nr:aldose epimerase [Anaerolineae bacterium]
MMPPTLHILENDHWQIGILPETGASVAFGRVKQGDSSRDVMRPTDPADYDDPSLCASFVLIPWSNRIRDARFRFHGQEYPLEPNSADGNAIHGDTRRRTWQAESAGSERLSLSFNSTAHNQVNFPWQFSALVEYWLDGADFGMTLSLKNIDEEAFPAGFGQHPYFVRTDDVQLELPVDQHYPLVHAMPTGAAEPMIPDLDFRALRRLGDVPKLDNLFRGRQGDRPARIVYPSWDLELAITSDPIFEHLIAFAPEGKPFFAVEPVTNANDGFNLFEQGIAGSGVFVLEPGEEKRGQIRLRTVGL